MAKYGKYITASGTTLMVRVPGFKQLNFHVSNADLAMSMRDNQMAEAGIKPIDNVKVICGVAKAPRKNKKDPDLPQYISSFIDHRTGNEYLRAFAIGMRSGGMIGPIHKDMSINKHGYGTCIRELLKWRKEKEKRYAKGR